MYYCIEKLDIVPEDTSPNMAYMGLLTQSSCDLIRGILCRKAIAFCAMTLLRDHVATKPSLWLILKDKAMRNVRLQMSFAGDVLLSIGSHTRQRLTYQSFAMSSSVLQPT